MDRRLTQWLVSLVLYLVSFNLFAGTPKHGEVLYRVNCGGVQQYSIDSSPVIWMTDNSNTPCPYVDVGVMGNRTYGTGQQVTLGPTVPSYVPPFVFQIERNLYNIFVDSLEYHFPVPYGKKVEVRLYFAEIYVNNVGERKFDIYIENQLKLKDFDIIAEVGKNVGLMKSYETTSDGMVNIYLKKNKNVPKINAIEIITIEDIDAFVRVNAGGTEVKSVELNGLSWGMDNMQSPSSYVNTEVCGNKVFEVFNNVSLDASVPSSTPPLVFKSARLLDNSDTQDLTYVLPVTAGHKVDVRLYFAELHFDNPGQRVMDVYVEDVLSINDFDVVANYGKFRGACKEFTLVSDGSISIRLSRVTEQPFINAIEIVESNKDVTITSLFNYSGSNNSTIYAYPNPFNKETSVTIDEVSSEYLKVIDIYGKEVYFESGWEGSRLNIQLHQNPNGIYYLLVGKDELNYKTVKLVKY